MFYLVGGKLYFVGKDQLCIVQDVVLQVWIKLGVVGDYDGFIVLVVYGGFGQVDWFFDYCVVGLVVIDYV